MKLLMKGIIYYKKQNYNNIRSTSYSGEGSNEGL